MSKQVVQLFLSFSACLILLVGSIAAYSSKQDLKSERRTNYTDPATGFYLKSVKPAYTGTGTRAVGAKQRTEVFSKSNKLLWKAETFVGSRSVYLSKDGKYLVLLGVKWSSRGLMPSPKGKLGSKRPDNPFLAQVFREGKLVKEVKFKDLFGDPPLAPDDTREFHKKRTNKNGIRVVKVPGRGVSINKVIPKFHVNWKQKLLEFTFNNGLKRKIKF